jgi:hypothetical protein
MTGSAWRARQRDDLIAPAGEEHVAVDEESAGPLSRNGREHRLEVIFKGCPRHDNVQADRASRVLHSCRVALGIRVVGIDQNREDLGRRHQLMQKPELLRRQRAGNQVHAGQVAARTAEAGDQAGLDRLDAGVEDNWNRGRRSLRRQRRRAVAGDKHGDLPASQFRRQRWQAIVFTLGPTVFDRDVLAFDIAGFG